MPIGPTTLTKLDELLAGIWGYADPRRAAGEWKQAYRLLEKAGLPLARVTHVVGMRDVSALAAMVEQLRAPAAEPPPQTAAPDAETCRRALAAFRKRLSLTVLDEESRLGHSPLTKGSDASVAAVVPPDGWPESVWQELARQGKLRYIGNGFYELPKRR